MTDYSKTVHLPQSLLPMKADLPKREPEMIDFWKKNDTYSKMVRQRKGKNKYILHDGPPYANGHIHMGHALNKILKDMIVKSRTMEGFYSPYVPGWDCHGLPIEHQLMKELKKDKHTIDQLEFRKKAASFAMSFVEIQRREFERLGVFGDWENPYLTLTPAYEGTILKAFRELVLAGYIYRGLKPVLWCPHCETALAEAEVEHEEKESPSIFVKLRRAASPSPGQGEGRGEGLGLLSDPSLPINLVIWTTTPWTLPANVGVMVHPDFDYAFVRVKKANEYWVIAKSRMSDLLEQRLKLTPEDYQVDLVLKGKDLAGWECDRIFPESGDLASSKVIANDNVSSEDGTGLVHLAPGHGDIDYSVGHLSFNLPVLSPVDNAGKFSETVNVPDLKGLFVLSKGNQKVLELLSQKGLLVHQDKIRHSYPHCWRCRGPVIFRATHQWFLSVEHNELRKKLLAETDNVQWIPTYGKNRIKGMLEQRPDWCLSRQRFWGTPIPIFYCNQCSSPLMDDQAIGMVESIVTLEGSDVWFREEPEYFLKNLQPFKCKRCGNTKFVKENDILDVWFESGVSHEAVLKGDKKTVTGETWKEALNWPADLYLEGSDQHRGWFQSSLIPSVSLQHRAPYRAVLTHGFIVDGAGKKMSKSQGNVIAPETILKEYGADILRLWVAASDYREDIRLSKDILKGTAENYRKIRNSLRYLIGNLADFNAEKNSQPFEQLWEIDRWALMRLYHTIQTCKRSYETCEFHRVIVALVEFCAVDCSPFYFDVLKDRLYTFSTDSPARRSAQTVLYQILSALARLLAPVLSFTAEEAWQIGRKCGHWQEESVFLKDFPEAREMWKDEKLNEKWKQIQRLREKANLALEAERQKRAIGGSLEAQVTFSGGTPAEQELLRSVKTELSMILIVSLAQVQGGDGDLKISVEKAPGHKCLRCWRYDITVKPDDPEAALCERCLGMIRNEAAEVPNAD